MQTELVAVVLTTTAVWSRQCQRVAGDVLTGERGRMHYAGGDEGFALLAAGRLR